MIGRTHGIHAEPTTFGAKAALWALQVDCDRTRWGCATAVAVCKLSAPSARTPTSIRRSSGTSAPPSACSRCRRRRSSPATATRSCCGPALPGIGRCETDRRRAAPPPAHRGRRGARGLQAGPEGLLGDAAQAQPDLRRDDQRPGPCHARGTSGRHCRTSRCGTSGTSRTRRSSGSSCPTPSARAYYVLRPLDSLLRNLHVDAERMRANLWSSHGSCSASRCRSPPPGAGGHVSRRRLPGGSASALRAREDGVTSVRCSKPTPR